MQLVLTEEQRELRTAVRSFLEATSPLSRVREVMESENGHDPGVWDRMGQELGLQGLIVPEQYGGAGAGMAELAVSLEELGAALLPGPFLATTVAGMALIRLGDEDAAKEFLPDIAAGRTVATVAFAEGDGTWEFGGLTTTAQPDGDSYSLSGAKPYVLNGTDADLLLVAADLGGRPAVFAVRGDADGVSRTPLTTLDLTRRQAKVAFAQAPARLINSPDTGAALRRTLDLAAVALAAEQLGVMRQCLESIVAYSKIRVAFGRYIGSYQGVKHKLADMHAALEEAESIVRYAAWAADEAPGELPTAAMLAQSYVGRACYQAANSHLILFGGIGFTWEHDAHLYYKRAKTDEVLLGPPRVHRARLADLLEI